MTDLDGRDGTNGYGADGAGTSADDLASTLIRFVRALDPLAQEVLDRTRGQVSLVQMRALRALADGPASVRELANLVGNHESTVSRLVDRLQTAGYVERSTGEVDKRVVQVSLTLEGRRLLDSATKHRRAVMSELAAAVAPEERDDVAAVLTRLQSLLQHQ
ncbi:MAG: MarR family winged helix-turn-helix transcriptional regulator [Actinomycetes bacterium]